MELVVGSRVRCLDTNKEGTIIDFLTKEETKECLMFGQLVKIKLDDGSIEERSYDYELIDGGTNIVEYFDGAIVSVEDVKRDFKFSSRNDFLKYSVFYSKDGSFSATIYDNEATVLIERTDD